MIGAVALQITLGILTIVSNVNIVLALLHQANALILFSLGIYFINRLRAIDFQAAVVTPRLNQEAKEANSKEKSAPVRA